MNKIGTVLLLSVFILSGIEKIQDFTGNVVSLSHQVSSKTGIMLPFFLYIMAIIITIMLEFVGSAVIIYSKYNDKYKKLAKYFSYGLVGFTILATLLYHFPPFGNQYYPFTKNLSIIGGLILLN